MRVLSIGILFVLMAVSHAVLPNDTFVNKGEVNLSLEYYQQLLEQSQRETPKISADYALGLTELTIKFNEYEGHVSAKVRALLSIETYEENWAEVSVLGPGAALSSARISGEYIQLVQKSDGLKWITDKKQSVQLELIYHVDSFVTDKGVTAGIPIPFSAATNFNITLPYSDIDISISPALKLKQSTQENVTLVSGSAQSSPLLMVAWRKNTVKESIISRAIYRGTLQESAINWDAEFNIEIFKNGGTEIHLLPTQVTLTKLTVDDKDVSIFSKDNHFYTTISKPGKHRVHASFQSPINYLEGIPSSEFDIPVVPISQFIVEMHGDKTLNVIPEAQVRSEANKGLSIASFFLQQSDRIRLSWIDALPDAGETELRATASIYQAVYSEEGVLYGKAVIDYEITRGEAKEFSFLIAKDSQVTKISPSTGVIADWLVEESTEGSMNQVKVFFNRAVNGNFQLQLNYEKLLEAGNVQLTIPLLKALNVSRQKGMLALLSSSELALSPIEHQYMSEVGENQLPAQFLNQLDNTVLHTYKYHSLDATIIAKTLAPERQVGKFDAQVDTLISIGEVTMKGVSSIEIEIKSGSLSSLQLGIPESVNVLGINGPSIRHQSISNKDSAQSVDIEFTQEMQGRFRIELNFEYIMSAEASQVSVPRIEVANADVEHGRIAVEALSALEVQAAKVTYLSSIDINELPKSLLLKTSNPILLAYKYVGARKQITLELSITRHKVIDVQVAMIDQAKVVSLFTRDGLAVNQVKYSVRNSRRQFLRLSLPKGAEIWSVFVDGKPQKPALASDDEFESDVLIKMINSATVFPVEVTYVTAHKAQSILGSITAKLAVPDMIVSNTVWDVFVPIGPIYKKPDSNMELLIAGNRSSVSSYMNGAYSQSSAVDSDMLRLHLPTQGVHYQFTKLYANQTDKLATFSIGYTAARTVKWGTLLAILAVILFWIATLAFYSNTPPLTRRQALMMLLSSGLLYLVAVSILGVHQIFVSVSAFGIGVVIIVVKGIARWKASRRNKAKRDVIQDT